jgi:uncharacterized membrane-anchored protein YitT (DUF2179 family)
MEHEAAPYPLRQRLADIANSILGVLCVGFALRGFLLPNEFFDGGITGAALVIHELHGPNVAIGIVLLNLPFILISIRLVNLRFAMRTLMCVVLLGLVLSLAPFPIVTEDKLLVSIFGGVFLGLGIGLAMRGGSALDGLEVLALYTGRRVAFTTSEIILGFNVVIFLIAASVLGLEKALYSCLTYYAASRTTNFVVEGLEEYTSMTIVSGMSEDIKRALVTELGRGITVYKGERGFLPGQFEVSHPVDIIFTVVTRLEVRRVRHLVHRVDKRAFIVTASAKEAVGGVISRRPSH